MKYTNFFLPTLKDAPSDAEIISHKLMIRSGMIKQSSAGIYTWLPLGLKVLKKIEEIVREEQNNAGAIEVLNNLDRLNKRFVLMSNAPRPASSVEKFLSKLELNSKYFNIEFSS